MSLPAPDVESPARAAAPRGEMLLLPIWTLAERELVRFFRQRTRLVGALGQPLLFWILFGAGLHGSFQPPAWAPRSMTYQEYFFPGVAVLIVMFTAIFSTISIIEDRREGFLQSVLVAPISPMVIVLGKVLGGTVLAFGQGLIFLALSPLIGFHYTLFSLLAALLMMFVMSFSLTALGFCIAWRMSSTQGFHAIMNLFLMPMWFLSGALFPANGAWVGLKWAIFCNPLSYGLAGLRRAMQWNDPHSIALGGLPVNLSLSILFAAVMFLIASALATGRVSADLQ